MISLTTRREIASNKAQCRRCKDVIESKHRHDYVRCSCGAVAVDGGTDYLRRAYTDISDILELSEYTPSE